MKHNIEPTAVTSKTESAPGHEGRGDAQLMAQATSRAVPEALKSAPASDKGFVLSDGQNVRPVNSGAMWVQARGGRKFRLLKGEQDAVEAGKVDAAGEVVVEKVAPVDAVVAVRDGQNLVLLVDKEHAVTLEDFFTQCIGDRCTVLVPSAQGEVPLVIESKMWQEGWSGVVYAYGDKGAISTLSAGYANAYPDLQQGLGEYMAAHEPASKPAGWLGWLAGGLGVAAAAGGGGGGGGSGGGGGETVVQPSTISGTFTGGPALASNNLVVQAYSSTGAILGSTGLNADGTYSLTFSGYAGVVVVKLVRDADSDADYMDESTQAGKDLDSSLFAVGIATAGQSTVINISPLTDIAARKMGLSEVANSVTSGSAEVLALNQLISKVFLGLNEDITKLNPQSVIDIHGAPATGDDYGKVLALLSGVEFALGSTTVQITQQLANNLGSNGTLSSGALEILALGVSQAIQDGTITLADGTKILEDLGAALSSSSPSLIIYAEAGTLNQGSGAQKVYFLLSAESTNFDASDVTVTGGTLSGFAQDSTNPRLYHATVTANAAYVGAVSIAVASGAFSNAQSQTNAIGFTLSLVGDTVPPTQSVGAIALSSDTGDGTADFVTKTASQTITGTLSATLADNDRLYGSVDGGTTWVDITSSVSGTTVTWAGVTLVSGAHTIQFKVVDKAGNTPSMSTPVNYTLDASAPTQTVSGVALSADTGPSGTDFITHTASQSINATLSAALDTGDILYGSVDGGATWVDISSMVSGTAVTWTGVNLLAGTNAIRFKVGDLAGNTEKLSTAVAYTLDTTIATPTLALRSDTANGSDGVTNDSTVLVGGLEVGGTWQYSTDAGLTWSTPAAVTSTGSSFVLPQGTYAPGDVLVRQTDIAGNTSPTSANSGWTIDTTPAQLTITSDATTGTAHGAILFTFTFDEVTTGFIADDIVVTGGTKGTFTATTTGPDAGKVYTLIVTPPDGGTGTVGVSVDAATSADVAGNATTVGSQFTLPYDTVAPSVAITSDKSGVSANGDIVFTFTFSEVMTGFDASDVTVTGGTKGVFQSVVGPNMDKVYTLIVTPDAGVTGEVTVSVAQGVAIGSSTKPNAASTEFHQPVDTLAPAAPTGIAEHGGTELSDGILNTAEAASTVFRVQLPSVADGTQPQVGDTLTLWVDGVATSRTVTLSTTDVNTNQYVDLTVLKADLGLDGAKSLTVVLTDAAGNQSTQSVSLDFTLDTSAPAALAIPTLQIDTGGADDVTSDGTIGITGLEAGAHWQYSENGGVSWNLVASGNTHQITGDGVKSITVRQIDAAGNVGDASGPLQFTLDASGPAVVNASGGTHLSLSVGGAAITNLDVAADIVLDFGHAVTTAIGAQISFDNKGGAGFEGETYDSDFVLYLGAGGKTYSDAGMTMENGTYSLDPTNNKLTLNPTADLDLANNYDVTISAGAVTRIDTGVSNASQTLSFSTVSPVAAAAGAEAVFMDGHTSRHWVAWSSNGQTSDATGGDYVFVLKDASPNSGTSAVNVSSDSTLFTILNFEVGDQVYLDSQGKTPQSQLENDFTVTGTEGVFYLPGDGPGTTGLNIKFDGYTSVAVQNDLFPNLAVIAG